LKKRFLSWNYYRCMEYYIRTHRAKVLHCKHIASFYFWHGLIVKCESQEMSGFQWNLVSVAAAIDNVFDTFIFHILLVCLPNVTLTSKSFQMLHTHIKQITKYIIAKGIWYYTYKINAKVVQIGKQCVHLYFTFYIIFIFKLYKLYLETDTNFNIRTNWCSRSCYNIRHVVCDVRIGQYSEPCIPSILYLFDKSIISSQNIVFRVWNT